VRSERKFSPNFVQLFKNFFVFRRYKDSDPVQPSISVSIVNEGTELRISQIKNEDIGDYTCIARNGEGRIHHVVKVLIAGMENIKMIDCRFYE